MNKRKKVLVSILLMILTLTAVVTSTYAY